MTRQGYAKAVAELKQLKGTDRPAVVDEIRRAREHGDLSENAEYDAAKERQGMIEARIRQLEDRVARAEVVETGGPPPDRVRFGTTVALEDLDSGESVRYTLVGEEEADAGSGRLSVASPIARALIGKAVGDTATVRVPAGTREFEVLEIVFE
ncbi:MAG: transcription elongation factor GreA [Proteobacteria bacterium]|nr:transcription elongation factor GreA [Pseudomonadota bacterium]